MLKPGMFISDRYEIIDKVGSGGMADVYKAKCHRLNRFVAIKVLKQEYSEDKKFVSKFRGEAQSAAGLSHPNIVNVYDVGEDDGLYYIVMELVEGITLKSFIERKGKLEVKETIGIAIQIGQGLEAAHNNHIIHRDIKPQNIIISREGKVKVTDFGIAKATSSNTITSNAMGSVHYISPEQARGGYSDERSDIYSLGITMYEMLTGKVPFAGDNTVSVALQHIQGEAMPLRDLCPDIPSSIDRIVQKCMQKKPERRYSSASELISDLKQAVTNPNGDFVKIAPMVVNNSPTIDLTEDEVSHIKTAAKVMKNTSVYRETEDKEQENTGELYENPEEEEDETGEIDPKLEKLIIGGSIAAAVILVLVIVFLLVRIFAGGKKEKVEATPLPSPSAPVETVEPSPEATEAVPTQTPEPEEEKITVIDFTGATKEDAEKSAKDMGLLTHFEEKPSDVFEAGRVSGQDLEEGTEVDKNTIITFTISTGTQTFKVPDVYGRPKNQADTMLEDAGVSSENISHSYEYSDSVEQDSVIRTEPGRSSDITKSDKVKVVLSQGPEKQLVAMPNIIDRKEAEAKSMLETAGLKAEVKYANSEEVKSGNVISANYTADTQIEKGTTVSITVSLGPKVVEPAYKYIASSVFVTWSPFEYEDEVAEIKIVLEQGEHSKTVYNATTEASEFPLPLGDIEGFDESTGSLVMYKDGENIGEVQTITFDKVAQ